MISRSKFLRDETQKRTEEFKVWYDGLVIEEYRALRAEIIRSAAVITSTIWLTASSFAITIAASFALHSNEYQTLYWNLLMLSLQSLAGSVVFIQELQRFGRAGRYIRLYIEGYFSREQEIRMQGALISSLHGRPPLNWEGWVATERSWLFYFFSLMILQSPNIYIFVLLVFSNYINPYFPVPVEGFSQFNAFGHEIYVFYMMAALVFDFVVTVSFISVLRRTTEISWVDFYAAPVTQALARIRDLAKKREQLEQ